MTNQDSFLIGIDAGGTKSKVHVWTEIMTLSPKIVFDETFSGINLDAISLVAATERLENMLLNISRALHIQSHELLKNCSLVMGMAGLDTPLDQQRAEMWFRQVLPDFGGGGNEHLLPDVELALWSATQDGEGLVLIAGTGSNCYGRTKDDRHAKTGGMSHFLSDEGSGFMLGWQALHLITQMYDGRRPETQLYKDVLSAYNLTDFAHLKRHIVEASDYKQEVAKAAPPLQELATNGDDLCQSVVQISLDNLENMVVTVADKLQSKDLPVFFVGGLFVDEYYRTQLVERLQKRGLQPTSERITDPVNGALTFFQSKIT